jgi:hypothetical protein
MASALHARGEYHEARECWQRALEHYEQMRIATAVAKIGERLALIAAH